MRSYCRAEQRKKCLLSLPFNESYMQMCWILVTDAANWNQEKVKHVTLVITHREDWGTKEGEILYMSWNNKFDFHYFWTCSAVYHSHNLDHKVHAKLFILINMLLLTAAYRYLRFPLHIIFINVCWTVSGTHTLRTDVFAEIIYCILLLCTSSDP